MRFTFAKQPAVMLSPMAMTTSKSSGRRSYSTHELSEATSAGETRTWTDAARGERAASGEHCAMSVTYVPVVFVEARFIGDAAARVANRESSAATVGAMAGAVGQGHHHHDAFLAIFKHARKYEIRPLAVRQQRALRMVAGTHDHVLEWDRS